MTSTRINLWSSPRNLSTALMYSFAQRPDTKVIDEPLYAHYLLHQPTTTPHPGRDAIIASQPTDMEEIIHQLCHTFYDEYVLVCKQMIHHLVKVPSQLLFEFNNVLLIRDPRAIIASYSKVVAQPDEMDLGFPFQETLYRTLVSKGHRPIILDATRLRTNPEKQLSALCHALNLNFEPAMLSWPAGPRPEDGVWAQYWYQGVHQSTGFRPPSPDPIRLPPHLEQIADRYRAGYERLLRMAI